MIEIDHEVVALIAEWAQQMEKRVMRRSTFKYDFNDATVVTCIKVKWPNRFKITNWAASRYQLSNLV